MVLQFWCIWHTITLHHPGTHSSIVVQYAMVNLNIAISILVLATPRPLFACMDGRAGTGMNVPPQKVVCRVAPISYICDRIPNQQSLEHFYGRLTHTVVHVYRVSVRGVTITTPFDRDHVSHNTTLGMMDVMYVSDRRAWLLHGLGSKCLVGTYTNARFNHHKRERLSAFGESEDEAKVLAPWKMNWPWLSKPMDAGTTTSQRVVLFVL